MNSDCVLRWFDPQHVLPSDMEDILLLYSRGPTEEPLVFAGWYNAEDELWSKYKSDGWMRSETVPDAWMYFPNQLPMEMELEH